MLVTAIPRFAYFTKIFKTGTSVLSVQKKSGLNNVQTALDISKLN